MKNTSIFIRFFSFLISTLLSSNIFFLPLESMAPTTNKRKYIYTKNNYRFLPFFSPYRCTYNVVLECDRFVTSYTQAFTRENSTPNVTEKNISMQNVEAHLHDIHQQNNTNTMWLKGRVCVSFLFLPSSTFIERTVFMRWNNKGV